jgi:hypothetical protein
MNKLINENGQKSYQRSDNEDRALGYRKWLRTVDTGGSFTDVDFIKFRNGYPVAITELTRCDNQQVPSENYFKEINKRWYLRDGQAVMIEEISLRLKIPAYLIVYSKSLTWFRVWSFQVWKWSKPMEPQEYLSWLNKL